MPDIGEPFHIEIKIKNCIKKHSSMSDCHGSLSRRHDGEHCSVMIPSVNDAYAPQQHDNPYLSSLHRYGQFR